MEDSKVNVGEMKPATVTVYRVYKRRWAIMASIFLLAVTNDGLYVNLASVSYKAADYFEVTPHDIIWFSQVFNIVPVPLVFFSTYIFNKFDLKAGIHIGSALNCVGALTRAVATSGVIGDISTQYVISLLGQAVAASGMLFISNCFTKATQNWYPPEERMMATSLMFFFLPLGISIAELMAPILVTTKEHIPTLNYVYGGMAVLGEIVTLVSVTRSRPPTPPSRSAEQGKAARAPFLQQLKDTFTCLPYLFFLFNTGILSSYFATVIALSQQMLCSMGYTDLFSGLVVTTFNVAGFLGSILIAMLANRTKALTPINKLAKGLGVVSSIAMMEVYLVPDQHALLIISSFLYGLFGCGVCPLNLELGVEAIYPAEETISTTLIFTLGQLLGVLMTYATSVFSRDLPPQLQHVEVCTNGVTSDLQAKDFSDVLTGIMVVLSLNVILFILFFRTPYKRMEAESTTNTNTISSCSVSLSDSTTKL